MKFESMIMVLRVFEARRLGHAYYFFMEGSLKEHIVDIKLMHMPAIAKGYGEDDLDCLWVKQWHKCFFEVNYEVLREAFSYQTHLIAGN